VLTITIASKAADVIWSLLQLEIERVEICCRAVEGILPAMPNGSAGNGQSEVNPQFPIRDLLPERLLLPLATVMMVYLSFRRCSMFAFPITKKSSSAYLTILAASSN
jgi:hypothetical protein